MTGNRNPGTPVSRIRAAGLLLVSLLLVALLFATVCTGCRTAAEAPAENGAPRTSAPVPEREAASSNGAFSFIVCGDPQNNYEVFDRIIEAARSVEFLIIAGDLTGSGTAQEFETFTRTMRESGVTYYCVPGNHDVVSGPVEGIYRRYVGEPSGSFDYGNSHFVLIDNSTPSRGFYPEERKRVERDLRRARREGFEHVFAVCHVPPGYPYSGSPDSSEIEGMKANEHLVPVLAGGGVDELFCGHVHMYESFEDEGITITITGGAGAPLHVGPEYGGFHHYVLVRIDGKKRQRTVVRI